SVRSAPSSRPGCGANRAPLLALHQTRPEAGVARIAGAIAPAVGRAGIAIAGGRIAHAAIAGVAAVASVAGPVAVAGVARDVAITVSLSRRTARTAREG